MELSKKIGINCSENKSCDRIILFEGIQFFIISKNIKDVAEFISDLDKNPDFYLKVEKVDQENHLFLHVKIKSLFEAMSANEIETPENNTIKIESAGDKTIQIESSDNNIQDKSSDDNTIQSDMNFESRKRIFSVMFMNYTGKDLNYIVNPEDAEECLRELSTPNLFDLIKREKQFDIYDSKILSIESIRSELHLNVNLRIYQIEAIRWLLLREKTPAYILPKQYTVEKCYTSDDRYYINTQTLEISNVLPDNSIKLPTGGILADEMGLGKSVEVIGLIMLNQKQSVDENIDLKKLKLSNKNYKKPENDLFCICIKTNKNDLIECTNCKLKQHKKCVLKYCRKQEIKNYICPECWASISVERDTLIKSKATVIVSPSSIVDQWESEINKNLKIKLKIFQYHGFSKTGWIDPIDLADYDVILINYAVLQKEIHYCESSKKHDLRTAKKYMKIKSPLLFCEWWRVCLDEAQMVESSTSNIAKMVKLLPAVHRWAVTGTPIQRSINDLKSLIDFIEPIPHNENTKWKKLISSYFSNDTRSIVKLLGKLMWRTSKNSVLTQIQIPSQLEEIHYVELSGAERLHYDDLRYQCVKWFEDHRKFSNSMEKLKCLDMRSLKAVMVPFRKLRENCTITWIVQNKNRNSGFKKVLQPKELVEHLKSTNEILCKSLLRTIGSCLNGMAAIHFIKENYENAVECYLKLLDLAKTYTGAICVDSLLQIHALYNITKAKRIIDPNSEIQEFETSCNALEWKYLNSYFQSYLTIKNIYDATYNEVEGFKSLISLSECYWWTTVFATKWSNSTGDFFESTNFLKYAQELFLQHGQFECNTSEGISYVLTTWADKIIDKRAEVLKLFKYFEKFMKNVKPKEQLADDMRIEIEVFVKSVFECHLNKFGNANNTRRKRKNGIKCLLCKAVDELMELECLLFNKTMQANRIKGDMNPSFYENILKVLHSILKGKLDNSLINKIDEYFLFLDALKKEYKELQKLWIEIEFTIKAYDELNMCKSRLQLDTGSSLTVSGTEIDVTFTQNELLLKHSENQFKKFFGRLKYIEYLNNKEDAGCCPVCDLNDNQYIVLQCGHSICIICFRRCKLLESQLSCPLCRHKQRFSEVYIVSKKLTNDISIAGEYPSKVEKILRTILKLKMNDPDVKIIIFSQWSTTLKVIEMALQQNEISFRVGAIAKSICEFKDENHKVTCLLLLLSQGGKGLNLIEATHVFLIEPILSPGDELQAINRIHRLGQKQNTYVHRFIAKKTIDETLFNTMSAFQGKFEFKELEIKTIQDFISVTWDSDE